MTPITTIIAARFALALATAVSMVAVSTNSASAMSLGVKMACASDYYANCSQYPVGSPGVRQCMRAHGPQLSKGCVSALIAAGEVPKNEGEKQVASK